ncbi:5-methylthioadenosine/S-adenosylhomocysteine deaminase [Syntrophus gentianae]|uniref:5-methylthioadenosine/S-adenosylhomocysteine deaminase n=1 Tax=Syntrophus gentianae TaxID=43775 RepID=A0A1H7W396_9BACT|nr:amidohydrolase [Syntrophus gentianae]SEM16006.1 5-methylthioadenosine/S-adenosylhomocysteine deaminase [Syntrophus gentianae]
MIETDLDLLIYGSLLLTMSKEETVIENPVLGIRDGKIVFVMKDEAFPEDAYRAKKILNRRNTLIMPGLVNTHTHLAMTCFRGMADDLPLMTWLNEHIFPAEAQHVNPEMVYAGSLLAMAEMILSGTTTFSDGYFFVDSVTRAAKEAGMRAVISQGFIDFPTPDTPDTSRQMDAVRRLLSEQKFASPLIQPALFCHSPYTCSPETLVRIKEAAREADILYILHLSETREEVSLIQDRYGKRPALHLRDLDVLDSKTLVVHCAWLDEEEQDILAKWNVRVSHAPQSNMKLAAGIAPIPAMQARGITIGLGTDGSASNNDLDLFLEMDTAAKIHKVAALDPTVMNARQVVRMATLDGARALGMEDRVGSIEVGKAADLIILDLNQPHLTPMYNPYSHLVYAVSGADVLTSIINGKVVMEDRKLCHLDLEAIMKEVNKIAKRIRNSRLK